MFCELCFCWSNNKIKKNHLLIILFSVTANHALLYAEETFLLYASVFSMFNSYPANVENMVSS